MANSAVEQIKKLDEQRRKLIDQAKHEALALAQEAVDALNELGYSYRLSSRGEGRGRKGARAMKDDNCPVCGFKTSPLHDGRRHRGQGDRKRPFSAAELGEMGYSKS